MPHDRTPRLPIWLLAALALYPAACSSQKESKDPAALAAATNQRLAGAWTLVDFRPTVALEPVLAQLLAVQVGRLQVQFDGARMNASGVGVQASRAYRIDGVDGDRFSATLFDDIGVTYRIEGTFVGNTLRFDAMTAPWTGSGMLQRAAQ